ncbi:MAG: DUF5335 family protein [Cystobacter sp.]
MAYTVEVPRRSWFAYFEYLSERASSHPIRLEVEEEGHGGWRMEHAAPLVGIDVESRERGTLEVTVGSLRRELTHRIDDPAHVLLVMDDAGNIRCIRVEAHDDTRSLLFFEGEEPVPAWFHTDSPGEAESVSPA